MRLYLAKGDFHSITRTVEKQLKLLQGVQLDFESKESIQRLREAQHEAYFQIGQLDKALEVIRQLSAESSAWVDKLMYVERAVDYAMSARRYDALLQFTSEFLRDDF